MNWKWIDELKKQRKDWEHLWKNGESGVTCER